MPNSYSLLFMASPVWHALLPTLIVRVFTKDIRYLILAFFAGAAPDIDGVFILFRPDLYYTFHHELLHPILVGVFFALIISFILKKKFKMRYWASVAVFSFSWALHAITDVFTSSWYVRIFWPLIQDKFSFPAFSQIEYLIALNLCISLLLFIISLWVFRKEINHFVKGFSRKKK